MDRAVAFVGFGEVAMSFGEGWRELLLPRILRALERLDAALIAIAPRLRRTATMPRLRALVAVAETSSFTLAAHALGLAQPSVHRAVAELEQEAGRRLFLRIPAGLVPTRGCQELATAVRLALAELERAEADLAEFAGRDGGRVVIGALPRSRSVLLPEALIQFRRLRPTQPVSVYDGRYSDLLQGAVARRDRCLARGRARPTAGAGAGGRTAVPRSARGAGPP